jgi:hypothetical protein
LAAEAPTTPASAAACFFWKRRPRRWKELCITVPHRTPGRPRTRRRTPRLGALAYAHARFLTMLITYLNKKVQVLHLHSRDCPAGFLVRKPSETTPFAPLATMWCSDAETCIRSEPRAAGTAQYVSTTRTHMREARGSMRVWSLRTARRRRNGFSHQSS